MSPEISKKEIKGVQGIPKPVANSGKQMGRELTQRNQGNFRTNKDISLWEQQRNNAEKKTLQNKCVTFPNHMPEK